MIRDLALDHSGKVDHDGECHENPVSEAQSQSGPGTPEATLETLKVTDSAKLESWVKRPYAHKGKRRRSYTEEMFRCQIVDQISRSTLVCNHLLWRNKPLELREHLTEHMKVAVVMELSDIEVLSYYTDAKKIYLQAIPEDEGDPNQEIPEEEDPSE